MSEDMIDAERFSALESMIRCGQGDPAARDRFSRSLQAEPVLALQADECGTTLLMIAADAANVDATRQLLSAGASATACSPSGETPITCVVLGAPDRGAQDEAEDARLAVAELLLAAGADVNACSHRGCNALHLAVIHARVGLVRLFLEGHADATVRLDDPPDEDSAFDLVTSGRFRGTKAQRTEISRLLAAAR